MGLDSTFPMLQRMKTCLLPEEHLRDFACGIPRSYEMGVFGRIHAMEFQPAFVFVMALFLAWVRRVVGGVTSVSSQAFYESPTTGA